MGRIIDIGEKCLQDSDKGVRLCERVCVGLCVSAHMYVCERMREIKKRQCVCLCVCLCVGLK